LHPENPETRPPSKRAVGAALPAGTVWPGMFVKRQSAPSSVAVGAAAVGTRVAIIPCPRVLALARNGSATLGLVLGHVIAHELGHLLLRRATHSIAGLMRSTLDLQLAQQGRLLFTALEAQAIRAAIARNAERR